MIEQVAESFTDPIPKLVQDFNAFSGMKYWYNNEILEKKGMHYEACFALLFQQSWYIHICTIYLFIWTKITTILYLIAAIYDSQELAFRIFITCSTTNCKVEVQIHSVKRKYIWKMFSRLWKCTYHWYVPLFEIVDVGRRMHFSCSSCSSSSIKNF